MQLSEKVVMILNIYLNLLFFEFLLSILSAKSYFNDMIIESFIRFKFFLGSFTV